MLLQPKGYAPMRWPRYQDAPCRQPRLRPPLPLPVPSITFRRMDSVLLANEVLKLSVWGRAQINDALGRSLDRAEQASIDEAWLAESRDRLRAYRERKLKAVDGEEALREIETGLRP